jgi:predicted phage tail protein
VRRTTARLNGDRTLDNDVIHGKCTSPYERSYRFNLPGRSTDGGHTGANTWDVRVSRMIPDSDKTSLQNTIVWQLLSVITDHNLMYSDTAYIALEIDAAAFRQGSIPTRTYMIDGRLVQVPAPLTLRVAPIMPAGQALPAAPGTASRFSHRLPDNAAWNFYDMVSHPRYGVVALTAVARRPACRPHVISQHAMS